MGDAGGAAPLDPVGWSRRAETYAAMKQTDKALADYSKAVELAPRDPAQWVNRGNFLGTVHQWDKALTDFSRAIELEPRAAESWNLRGVADLRLDRSAKALADFSRAIELQPDAPGYWRNRGCERARQGQWQSDKRQFVNRGLATEVIAGAIACDCRQPARKSVLVAQPSDLPQGALKHVLDQIIGIDVPSADHGCATRGKRTCRPR